MTQFNLSGGTLVRSLTRHKSEVIAIALVWSAATGMMRMKRKGRLDAKQTKEEIIHGALVVSASADRTLYISSARQGYLLTKFEISAGDLACLATMPQFGLIAAGSSSGALSLWKIFESSAVRHDSRCEGHEAEITGLIFLGDHSLLVSADAQTELILWRVATLKCIPLLRWWHRSARDSSMHMVVTALAFEPARNILFTGDEEGTLNVWWLSQLHEANSQALAANSTDLTRKQSTGSAPRLLGELEVSDIEPEAMWVGHEDAISALVQIDGDQMESGSRSNVGLMSASHDRSVVAWLINGANPESDRECNLCGRLSAGWAVPLDRASMQREEEERRTKCISELSDFDPPDGLTAFKTRHLLHRYIEDPEDRASRKAREKQAALLSGSGRAPRRAFPPGERRA